MSQMTQASQAMSSVSIPAVCPDADVVRARLQGRRRRVNLYALTASLVAMGFGLFWLAWILWTTVTLGVGGLSLDLFTQMTPAPNTAGGGLANAIFGSFVMVGMATLFGTPLGILAGIYLAEYGKSSPLASLIRFINDILLSAPSIVIGLFVYALVVTRMGHFSGWAGICALALLQVPIVTLKSARAGVMTGVLLAIARIAGETAPLLFTALSNQFWTSDLNKPMANLPVTIFRFAMSPFTEWQQLAWAGVFLITLGVLALNILARILFKKK